MENWNRKRRKKREKTILYPLNILHIYIARSSRKRRSIHIILDFINAMHNVIVGSNEPLSKCWHCQIEKERGTSFVGRGDIAKHWIERDKHTYTPSRSTIQRRRFNFLLFNSIVWGFLFVSSISSLSFSVSPFRWPCVVSVNYIEQLFSCGFISVIYTLVFPFHLILC